MSSEAAGSGNTKYAAPYFEWVNNQRAAPHIEWVNNQCPAPGFEVKRDDADSSKAKNAKAQRECMNANKVCTEAAAAQMENSAECQDDKSVGNQNNRKID